MRSALQWPLLLTLAGACALVNDPSDHQGDSRDAGNDATPLADAGVDATPLADAGNDTPPDAGPSLTAEAYCAAYAEIMCAANANPACCEVPTEFATCEETLVRECEPFFVDILLGGVRFDGVRATAAIASLRPLAAACDVDVAEWAVTDFFSPLIGERPPFDTCGPPPQTAQGFIQSAFSCDRSVDDQAICQPNTEDEWVCQVRKDAGDCYIGTQCTSNRCEFRPGYPLLTPGQCGPGGQIGDTCSRGRIDHCESLVCAPVNLLVGRCAERTVEAVLCRTE